MSRKRIKYSEFIKDIISILEKSDGLSTKRLWREYQDKTDNYIPLDSFRQKLTKMRKEELLYVLQHYTDGNRYFISKDHINVYQNEILLS